ncbi:N-methyl-L-tryptophan oxidase [Mesorhizobium sp.]|uniref:N-methyl-L-tryptophan oxidase n=1 Tax=Mesorhizobium sp. TaxID=1871066 RepID=UPI000FE3C92D|nr:N-methyl-L-tryptophan oxidase [Mesorhizobium sp.]RWH72902.1 MAG: N-methyl-L-tryptophan oxidase [Mesorhizobium sp.]RWL34212.1 MAG: N-methyl-L-tryptophan oxidase [Mesorhizobium sp.]RWL35628.1 MAG: N-methyl-L-tryptophan oxidase [Mesorhizobium sp.]RWL41038.1 MAG: N-methyl-L-tryptophan oxidase [Mesorhizobium sp.]RWL52196.1 MAG: N-methyl-L-tryptophan oxidase [Mesorhizobium sp.]
MHDVGVVGLGAMGALALWHLARRGVSAIGFEQFNLGNDRAAHSGETRLFRTAYLEGEQYIPVLRHSLQQWRELEKDTQTSLLALDGAISVGPADHPSIAAVVDCVSNFGLSADVLSSSAANARFPALNVRPDEIAILDREGGILAAELSVIAAATRAEDLGAIVHRRLEVLSLEHDADGVWIRTSAGDHRVRRAIVAAGAWTPSLLDGEPAVSQIALRRINMTWFAARRPEKFAPAAFPAMMRFTHGRLFGIFPSQDGRTIKAGSEFEIKEVAGPLDVPLRPDRDLAERTIAMVKAFYPDIYPEPLRTEFWTDSYTADHRPIVGPLPGRENIILATGFSGHGFKMAPTVGAALSDYATEGTTALPLDFMLPGVRG